MKEEKGKGDFALRSVKDTDAQAIADIYNHYVEATTTSFETEPLTVEQMGERIALISAEYPYFVCVSPAEGDKVVGYCCAHLWKERRAYCNTLEVTIYLDPQHKGRGAGSLLMRRLIEACREMKTCRNLIACITEENAESIKFHAKMGFEKVSHFKKVGNKLGRWLDVVDMQMELF